MSEEDMLFLLIQGLMLIVFSYLIMNTNKKQQMMVNGLSHVWGQLDEIKKIFNNYTITQSMKEWKYDVEPPIVVNPNNTFNTETPNSNDSPMKHEE
jgi:hypothetical protein